MEIKKYKKELEKELKLLTRELKSDAVVSSKNPNDWIAKGNDETNSDDDHSDSNDNADDLEELGEKNAIVSDLEIRFRNVNEALKRIEENNFGKCKVCDEPIEEARLEANPAATTCMEHINS